MSDSGAFARPAECPGIPSDCGHASRLLMAVGEGVPSPTRTAALRQELTGCAPCLEAFDLQVNVQNLVALHCREQAPESLRIRISETLQRIDLGNIDVTDL